MDRLSLKVLFEHFGIRFAFFLFLKPAEGLLDDQSVFLLAAVLLQPSYHQQSHRHAFLLTTSNLLCYLCSIQVFYQLLTAPAAVELLLRYYILDQLANRWVGLSWQKDIL